MKVLLINGSPHSDGVIKLALDTISGELVKQGIETELIQVGNQPVTGCLACAYCKKVGKCVKDDIVNQIASKFEEADGLVIGSPTYYASANGTLISFLDRLFYSTRFDKSFKVGAAVVSCRRGGNSATFDELNKYFSISCMPIATSSYWNSIHGNTKAEALQDSEGLKTMRDLGRNMAYLIKAINAYKKVEEAPQRERGIYTNFIR